MEIIEKISSLVWGSGTIALILFCGILFTVKFKLIQFKSFKAMLKLPLAKTENNKGISSFAAMATALGGTMGVGNIIGVGSAIAIGGVGAVFWMWISAFFGMATKYAENYYAVKYRTRDKKGKNIGGPMAYMEYGLGAKGVSKVFCILTAISSLGVGNCIQIGALKESLDNIFSISPAALCPILLIIAAFILTGGAERISKLSSFLIPILSFLYIGFCLIVIGVNYDKIPNAFAEIFKCAFDLTPILGGLTGTGLCLALKTGVNHGVFSNEAGMGSSSIAHACGNGSDPEKEGLWGMFEVFFDTVICCTLTALAIIVTQSHSGFNESGDITSTAFQSVFGKFGSIFIAVSISLFAFATLISWYFYGEKSIEYLGFSKLRRVYLIVYIAVSGISCFFGFSTLLPVCDILNGLTVIPNVICLIILSTVDKDKNEAYNNVKSFRGANFK